VRVRGLHQAADRVGQRDQEGPRLTSITEVEEQHRQMFAYVRSQDVGLKSVQHRELVSGRRDRGSPVERNAEIHGHLLPLRDVIRSPTVTRNAWGGKWPKGHA
jgi:hypothetical protein